MPGKGRSILRTPLGACALLGTLCGAVPVAWASAWTPEEGGGIATFGLQYTHVQRHLGPDGEGIDVGSIDSRGAFLQGSYGITDRLAVSVSLPFLQKRYKGPANHRIADEHGHVHFADEDNGNWHGEFQDYRIAMQYQFTLGAWAATPYVAYGAPSNDYNHFAHAATGSNQEVLEFGAEIARVLPAPYERVYVQTGYSYSFLEKYRHVDVDRSNLTLEAGYLATERLSLRTFVFGQKSHGGLDFPIDYPYTYPPPNTSRTEDDIKLYYHHDQTQRVDFIEAGCGGAYRLSAQTAVFASWLTTLWGENGHATDYAISVGLTRAF